MTEKDKIWLDADDVLLIDEAVAYLHSKVNPKCTYLNLAQAKALRVLADKAQRYRNGKNFVDALDKIIKESKA